MEAAVEAAEAASSREAALEQVRPAAAPDAVTLPAGLRWLRRRLSAVRTALLAAVTLVPALAGCRATLSALRERLSVGASEVLVTLRRLAAAHLAAMSSPVGFRARARRVKSERKRSPHEAGPDPPRQSQ